MNNRFWSMDNMKKYIRFTTKKRINGEHANKIYNIRKNIKKMERREESTVRDNNLRILRRRLEVCIKERDLFNANS